MDKEKKEDKEFVTTTSQWSDEIEKVLTDIGESCQKYKILCAKASLQDTIRYDIFMYVLLALGPITSALSAISTAKPENTELFQIIITIFSMMSGLFSAVIKFSKFDQRSTLYKTISAKYASLEGNIRRQLSLRRNERVNAGKYLEWVSTSYDELFSSTPISQNIDNENIIIISKHSTEIKIDIKPQKEPSFADLNRYDDAKMRYEMLRLQGFSQPEKKEKDTNK